MRIRLFSRSLKNLLLTYVLVMAAQSAEAANRFVDGDGGSDGGNNCTSAGSPCASVSRAIDVAVGGDTIRIADAVYTEILQVDKALTFSGASRAGTIIQAAANRGDAADRTMTIAEDVAVQLSDLTIRHGNTNLNGGGLRSFGGDLLVERVTFTSNDAEGQGAGLASGENVIVMNDVVFRDNGNSDTSEGGGARLGENQQPTDVTLNNVTFENNAAGGSGGGLRLFRARAVLRNVAFIGNTSIQTNGGGLSYVGGGGITASTLELRDSVFIGNSAADGSGGGMDTTFETPYTMVNVLFSGNLANLGGGIFNQGDIDGTRVLTNVTMTGNRATLRGGAIDKPLDMTFRNTVIWNNADSSGTGTPAATMADFSPTAWSRSATACCRAMRRMRSPVRAIWMVRCRATIHCLSARSIRLARPASAVISDCSEPRRCATRATTVLSPVLLLISTAKTGSSTASSIWGRTKVLMCCLPMASRTRCSEHPQSMFNAARASIQAADALG